MFTVALVYEQVWMINPNGEVLDQRVVHMFLAKIGKVRVKLAFRVAGDPVYDDSTLK